MSLIAKWCVFYAESIKNNLMFIIFLTSEQFKTSTFLHGNYNKDFLGFVNFINRYLCHQDKDGPKINLVKHLFSK